MDNVTVGIIGCGVISDIYLTNLTSVFPNVDVRFCADIVPEKAQSQAEKYGVPKHGTTEELLADDAIEIVVNLTTPLHHYPVAKEVLEAGKCVYNEKPLSINRVLGRELLEMAREKGLLIGGAPDTFLGAGIQACRRAIDDGLIGEIVGATAFFTTPGHERWHPAPAFYYAVGGGPVFDMAPYYFTAMVSLIGPVAAVTGHARKTAPERVVGSEPLKGAKIPVEVPTHYSSSVEFANGAIGTAVFSFDVWGTHLPKLEIYGTKGSLGVPDPNTYDGPALWYQAGEKEWEELPLGTSFRKNSRGLGVADMAFALRNGRRPRADGALTYHVLDIMEGLDDGAKSGGHYRLESRAERPAPMPVDAEPKGWE